MSKTLFTPERVIGVGGLYRLFHTDASIYDEEWAPLFRWARWYRASGKQVRLQNILETLMKDPSNSVRDVSVEEGGRSERLYSRRVFEAALRCLICEMGGPNLWFYKRWPGT